MTEAPWSTSSDVWWWFKVSSDAHHRYAPFKACSSDTRASVAARIVKYHDDLRERRAAPPVPHWRRRNPQAPTGATVPAATAVTQPAVESKAS